jgi:biotin carboxylase
MRCAVVDAYSTGRFLPAALRWLGAECLHVQSSPDVPDFYRRTFPAGELNRSIVHDGDLDATARTLADAVIEHVIAGAETGVELADALAARLGLPGHGMSCPLARRDKYLMARQVRRAGLDTADGIVSDDAQEIIDWAPAWPIVLKPLHSAGTDNVIFCHDPAEIRSAHQKIMSSPTLLGGANTAVLAQEFLAGDEYFANTVSAAGRHHVAEVWRYHKRPVPGGAFVYDYEHPMPAEDPRARRIAAYVTAVLDALEIRDGPAHTEVMLTARGPVLIECGARLAGSILPDVVRRCFGTDHVELTALARTDPERFARMTDSPYRLRTHLRYVSLICPRAGTVDSTAGLDQIRALPSYAAMSVAFNLGQRVAPTVDSASSPGYVYLVSDDPDQIATDYRRLRDIEQTTLYGSPPVAP